MTLMIRRALLTVSIFVSLLVSTIGICTAAELDDVRTAIKEKGATWTAGDTLPQDGKSRRTGLIISPRSAQQKTASTVNLSNLTAPQGSFDWRNNAGVNYVTSVKDQGDCGSCTAFAVTAALESNLLKQGFYNVNLDESEQILVSCGGVDVCAEGLGIDTALNFIHNSGLTSESCYPYTATDGSCSNTCPNFNYSFDKLVSWDYVITDVEFTTKLNNIKNSLYNNGPLVATMLVYVDFWSHYNGGVYQYAYGSEIKNASHAVTIVGYSDDTSVPSWRGGYFIVKNSWGNNWAEGGYFRIAYSELDDSESVVHFADQTVEFLSSSAVNPLATVTTGVATAVTGSGATLNGKVNANNTTATVAFEYGTGDFRSPYTNTVPAAQSPISGIGETPVNAAITGLAPNTLYHFRSVATNPAGESDGSDVIFNGYYLTVTKLGLGQGTISSTSPPSVVNCDSKCSYGFYQNTQLTLTATPKPGYIFSGWSGACTGKGPCSVTMSSAQSVNASFTEITPIIMMMLDD